MNQSDCQPINALLGTGDDAVLAVIADVSGPSYRPLGAMMTILGDASRKGLSLIHI